MKDIMPRLTPEECRDDAALSEFVRTHISVNAWPVQSPALLRALRSRGIDLGEGRRFELPVEGLEHLLRRFHASSRRVERVLGIENAFHTTLHGYEVLLRLLILEQPEDKPLREGLTSAAERVHPTLESIRPILLEAVAELLARGVPARNISRDVLAALGHDYGHTGGTDRIGRDGGPTGLTHEETAERHTAKFGLSHGFPVALILEALGGIRATTFTSQPGRDPVEPANDFEHKLALADVMGCALPADAWLTHVALPVLKEKIDSPGGAFVVGDLEEFFRTEHRFLGLIETRRLARVPGARELWGETVRGKRALLEELLERKELMAPLAARGFDLLRDFATSAASVPSLGDWLDRDSVDPELRELLLSGFVPGRTSGT